MATPVNDENQTLVMTDGYNCKYNVYYDSDVTNAPIVLFMHGSSGDRTNAAGNMKSLRTLGFVTITIDSRGSGDGGGTTAPDWIGDNGYSGADYGWGIFNRRDLLDVVQILNQVAEDYPTYANQTKIGLAGQSRGAILSWLIAGLGEQGAYLDGIKVPRITAIAPDSYHPRYATGIAPKTRDRTGIGGNGVGGRTVASFEDNSSNFTNLTSAETWSHALFDGDNPTAYRDAATGRSRLSDINNELERASHYLESAAESLPYDFPIFLTQDIDDRWGNGSHDLKYFAGRKNAFCLYGAHDGHGATNVLGEDTRVSNKQAVFFQHFLQGDTTVFGDYFDSDSPTATRQVELLLTPNNPTDFADETNAIGAMTSAYSWASIFADKHQDLYAFGDEDATASETSLSTPTPLYVGETTAVFAAPSGADWTTTISNTWTTATTAADVGDAVESGPPPSGSNIDSYYSTRLTHDTNYFQATWLGAYERIYFGIARGKFWASATQPGAQLHARLQYSGDNGSNWNEVSNTWYVFPDDYTAGDITALDLDFDLRGMFLDGAASNKLFRIQFSNYGKWDLAWHDGNNPVTIHPCFDNNTVTLYHGETYPSRVVLPLHDISSDPTATHFQP
jgi:hypothetical protein